MQAAAAVRARVKSGSVKKPRVETKGLLTLFYNQLQRRRDVEDLLVLGLPKVRIVPLHLQEGP